MSTKTKVYIILDEEEISVNTVRVLTLRNVWIIKAYRQNKQFLDQLNLGNHPFTVLIPTIECSL